MPVVLNATGIFLIHLGKRNSAQCGTSQSNAIGWEVVIAALFVGE
ncbi:hypothetical protein [Undibacterium sp. RuTC16W]